MPEIHSPLGRRVVASSAATKVLNVPDESSFVTPTPSPAPQNLDKQLEMIDREELNKKRKESLEASKRISGTAKERIEFLLELGRAKKDVVFEGVTFSLQGLRAGEWREILMEATKSVSNADTAFLLRSHTLARSLYAIDGKLISLIIGSNQLEDVLNLIDSMEEDLVEYLHNEYSLMVAENKKKFTIKTEEEAKEVSEDLKK